MTELTCKDVIEFLAAYRDGELPAPVRADFEAHLRACPPCVDYLRSYERTIALGREALTGGDPAAAPMAPVPERLVRAILDARRRTPDAT